MPHPLNNRVDQVKYYQYMHYLMIKSGIHHGETMEKGGFFGSEDDRHSPPYPDGALCPQ